ncbi:hypothetical protein, partial [Paraburkholderia sabiae]|uniref:hypothetical protein n=1 Tax=Paraburkholderia sabiae TaxID=273251 RepID=UPI001F373380
CQHIALLTSNSCFLTAGLPPCPITASQLAPVPSPGAYDPSDNEASLPVCLVKMPRPSAQCRAQKEEPASDRMTLQEVTCDWVADAAVPSPFNAAEHSVDAARGGVARLAGHVSQIVTHLVYFSLQTTTNRGLPAISAKYRKSIL